MKARKDKRSRAFRLSALSELSPDVWFRSAAGGAAIMATPSSVISAQLRLLGAATDSVIVWPAISETNGGTAGW